MPRINLTSVLVDDQERALRFYTEMLGFVNPTTTTAPMTSAFFITARSDGARSPEQCSD